MNLSLQDPFAVAKEYPETLVNTFQYGHSVIIQFNHKGDYLASGLSDGSIIIYDMISNGGVVAHLNEDCHIRPITSLSWSKCGRYLLTSSQDWYVKLWDLSRINGGNDYKDEEKEFGENESDIGKEFSPVIRSIKFDGPIWMASMHPIDHFKFTASLFDDSPVFVDMTDHQNIQITKLQTMSLSEQQELETEDKNEENEEEEEEEANVKRRKRTDKHMTLVSTFNPNDGNYIFTGTSKGWLNIIQTSSLKTVHSIKLTNSNIKNVVISSNGRKLAINSSDRIIRQISLPDLINEQDPENWEFEIDHKYQDMINKLQWNSVAFNHNADFLVASTYGHSSHDLYVWETSIGSLIKILEGSNEELVDVKWDYSRCCIGSTGIDSGSIYIWSIQFPQKWSALAPDFVEIEENIEYEEKEDEFDIINEDTLKRRQEEEEDLLVDVITREKDDARGFDITQPSFIIPINYENQLFI
ncbi:WD40-repeat-containing domain protein [Scheffersomyces amazonensis]|uniref:WD40-repeat-containing domain protein n=1 Tax=Scheffersomyces amazonensis TaxID=1078765 RepID=UPI00315D50FF